MPKLTKQDAPKEPIAWLQGYGVIDQTPIPVWECELCLSVVTDLPVHMEKCHASVEP